MERLTYDFALGGNHCLQVKGADNLECREVCERQGDDGCKTCPIAKAFDRLAAIEDILGDEYDLEELKELVQAKRKGRCVVLPCKIGDTLYRIQRFKRGKSWRKEAEYIRTVELNKNNFWRVVFEGELGETVFLTRESAEAALAREKVCRECKEGWAKLSTLEKSGERCSDTCERYKTALKGDQNENL